MYAFFHLHEVCFEESARPVSVIQIHGGRVAYLFQDVILQRSGQQRQIGDEVTVHLTATTLQLWIGCEQRIDVLNEAFAAHIQRAPQAKELHILLYGDVAEPFLRIG